MSYQVLARKWRPRTFAQMAGQEHVLRALTNGLGNGRIHHAYLFTGTRGVGKTTVARILCKCLNCETNGISAEPCGECNACREIDEGRFVDLIEVDAASRTKVEDTRELLDNVQYAPTRGRYKIYLIDEVHMLSGHSFNALLKTLEEPPPHVKFLLATTDPQKLPVTVLSRCLQFNLKHLPASLIAEYLGRVLEREGIEAEAGAVARVARAAEGSMRDALSLMDQALAFCGGSVTEADVHDMLGTIESDFVFELLEAVSAEDGSAVLAVVERMAELAPDFGDALAEVLAVLHQLALVQTVPNALPENQADGERLQALAQRMSPQECQLFYQIALAGRRDLGLAPDPRTGFEMTLLRMLAFRPAGSEAASEGGASASPAAGSRRTETVASEAPTESRAGAEADSTSVREAPTADRETDWMPVVAALPLSGMARALAEHCDWGGREDGVVRLRIDEGHRHLINPSMQERVRQALCDYFGEDLRLNIEVGTVAGETPAAASRRAADERQQAAEQAIETDPNVAAFREAFGARVIANSVRPTDD
ncbi:MAG TPA: DNA polymerase III subunit gamma/tau [Gammaproteobacteria bacterium]|nr:DNA polymerase III subunit gamma/tau [Gammaproteobacteria bacterium]